MITAIPFFDMRKKRKDNTYPVKVEVNFSPKIRSKIMGAYLTEEEWETLYNPRLRDKRLLSIKSNIDKEVSRANKIIEDLSQYEKLIPENYRKLMGIKDRKNDQSSQISPLPLELNNNEQNTNPVEPNKKKTQDDDIGIPSLYELYEGIIEIQNKKDSGTGKSYQSALNSFRDFKPNLKYSDITPTFFEEYETYMLNKEKTLTTVGIYCRSIRTAVIDAFEKGYLKKYPFGLRSESKYSIPTGKRSKRKALKEEQLKQLINFSSDSEEENYAVAILNFSFLCNGMNPRDIFHLKAINQNPDGNDLEFVRKKTVRMTKETIIIEVPLVPQVVDILEKWGTKKPRPNEYIFPLLNNLYNQIYNPAEPILNRNIRFQNESYRLISNEIRRLNRILLKVEKKINSPIHLTTGVGRYSFANFMDRKGAPIKYIQESLGHTDPATTLRYLDSLRQEDKKEFTQYLEAL